MNQSLGATMDADASNNDDAGKTFAKKMLSASVALLASGVGFVLASAYWTYAKDHNAFLAFSVTPAVSVDFFGALLPLAAGIVATGCYFAWKRSAKRFVTCFAVSLGFAAVIFRISSDGLLGEPVVFAVLSGTVAALLMFAEKPFTVVRRKIAASVLAAVGCAPLALLLVDVVYVPFFAGSTIGGNGLTDAVLISTLYAAAWAGMVAAVTALLVQSTVFLKNWNPKKSASAQP